MRILFFMLALLCLQAACNSEAAALQPSDAPFTHTVECYINGAKVGKNIKWKRRDTYQATARELYQDTFVLFSPGDHVRFLVEFPRYGDPAFNMYGCVSAIKTLTIVADPGACP